MASPLSAFPPIHSLSTQENPPQDNAAKVIQKLCRGYLARVHTHYLKQGLLDSMLFEQTKALLEARSSLADMPQASAGKTTVYLPKELPIVLKLSGSPANYRRFHNMQAVRLLCEKKRFKTLVVPQARVYEGLVIESRLPLPKYHTKQQIGLYIENQALFTQSAQEFVALLYQSTFTDLISDTYNPYGTLSDTFLPRYDNVTFYLEKGQGRLAIVDSEEFSDKMPKLDKKTSFIMCFKAVLFFPHHFEDILSVAQTFDPDIHLRRDELQAIQQQALKRFKIIYDDHLKFVLDQGITLQQATVVRPLNPDKVKRLEKVIADWLRLQHNDKYMTPDLLGSDPETAIAKFHQDFLPRFLVHLYVFFTRMLEENAQSYEGRASSMTELLRIRTLEFTKQHACYNTFIETVCAIPRDMLKLKYETSFLHYHLLDLILNELVKEGEIAYYNRELGYGGRTIHCIFC